MSGEDKKVDAGVASGTGTAFPPTRVEMTVSGPGSWAVAGPLTPEEALQAMSEIAAAAGAKGATVVSTTTGALLAGQPSNPLAAANEAIQTNLESKRQVAASLRTEGLSVQQIALRMKAPKRTVQRWLAPRKP